MTVEQQMMHHKVLTSVAAGLGTAGLATLRITEPLLSSRHLILFHLTGSSAPFISAAAFGVVLATLMFAALWYIAGLSLWAGRLLALAVFASLPGVIMSMAATHFDLARPELWQLWTQAGLLSLLVLLLAASPRAFDHVASFGKQLLCWCSLFSIAVVFQLLSIIGYTRHLNDPAQLRAASATSAAAGHQGKIIWILMDELSYRQVYEHPAQGVRLPAFDQLRAESSVFTHTVPAGLYTSNVLPSLITGRRVTDVRSTWDGRMIALFAATGKWSELQPASTVFADADANGYNSGIEGWYNPYCRVLPGELYRCGWALRDLTLGGMTPGSPVIVNALWAAENAADAVIPVAQSDPAQALRKRQQHAMDYQQLLTESMALLRDPEATFVFLHLPVPHMPGIYNRRSETTTASSGTYLDNLTLADRTFARIHDQLVSQSEWDNSTIVLMGDHSWRVQLLRQLPSWTAEEERASDGGVFDDRPAYVVKLPNQHTGTTIDSSYNALRTRDLFDHLFTGQMTTPEQLAQWAAAPASVPGMASPAAIP